MKDSYSKRYRRAEHYFYTANIRLVTYLKRLVFQILNITGNAKLTLYEFHQASRKYEDDFWKEEMIKSQRDGKTITE
jgi:hypothetical protein